MNHFISLDQAKKMTALYRQEKENVIAPTFKGKDILSLCETFDAAPFLTVLNKPECKSLRIYFGMSDDLKVHTIIVGVNENNEDILPQVVADNVNSVTNSLTFETPEDIIEEGALCPPVCPPPSPLNV